MSVTKLLATESEFKAVVDALLRLEVSRLVQTYDAFGADGGVDADFHGTFEGVTGRWVFQYKFVEPTTDANRARARVRDKLAKGTKKCRPEFDPFEGKDIAGYVLITNVSATTAMNADLRAEWRKRSTGTFTVWDRSTLDSMFRQIRASRFKPMPACIRPSSGVTGTQLQKCSTGSSRR